MHQHLIVRLYAGDTDQDGRDAIERSVRHVIDYDDELTNADVQVKTMRWVPSEQTARTAGECVRDVPWGIVDTKTDAVTRIVGGVYASSLLHEHVAFEVELGTLYRHQDDMLVVALAPQE